MRKLNCGETAPESANYKVVGPNGESMGTLYMKAGETFPPTQVAGCHYEMD